MWPFKKKADISKLPEQVWIQEYEAWLAQFQGLVTKFPDHEGLEDRQLDASSLRLLDQITDLYTEDLRVLLEQLVLKGEMLRRSLSRKAP